MRTPNNIWTRRNYVVLVGGGGVGGGGGGSDAYRDEVPKGLTKSRRASDDGQVRRDIENPAQLDIWPSQIRRSI